MLAAISNRLISITYIVFIALTSVPLFVIALLLWLVTAPFDPRLTALHLFTCFWASLYLWVFPAWTVKIENRELIDPAKTYVMVSNHQSLVDILVVFRLFAHFKWVSKREVFRLPLIGWNMWLNRYVELERGQQESIARMYDACDRHLQQGSSIYMFPEGTRSSTGQMREFKEGAFVLAQKNRVPLLVLAIDGSRDALPKHSLTYHGRHHISLTVLGEVPYAEFAGREPAAVGAAIRTRIERHLERARARADSVAPLAPHSHAPG